MGSSSSKQSNTLPQGQTITQTGLPSYFQPYVMDVLQRGQEASYQPYTPYKDQRIAGFTPGQIQAQEGVLGLKTPGQFGTATQFATQAGQMGLGAASQYMPGQFTTPQVSPSMVRAPQMNAAQTGFAPNLQAFEMAGPEKVAAERATTGSFIQPGTASQYMSPYMQNVVDVQKQAAIEDARKAQLGANLGAARQGTYGGARQLLAQTEREKALGQQLGQIQATGSQAAYDAALRQFEAEQGRGLQAQQLNVQSQLQAQLANQQAMQQKAQQDLAARLGVQELGTQTGLQTALANLSSQQQANVQNLAAELQTQGLNQEQALRAALANQQSSLEAQRLQEQSRQYGAGLGLQGAGMGLEAARTLGGLGSAQQQAEIQRLGAISGAGAEQQALTQQQMDLAYQDFLRQQQYPMSQLQQYAGLLSGLPSPGQTQVQSTYSQPASLASQLAGLGLAGYGAYKTFGSAKGGEVKNYNVGGLVAFAGGGDTPEPYTAPQSPKGIAQAYGGNKQAIQQAMQSGVVDPTSGLMAAMLIDKMQAPSGAAPQGTVADQVFGRGLNTPEIATAADGGIIGYAAGGDPSIGGFLYDVVSGNTELTYDPARGSKELIEWVKENPDDALLMGLSVTPAGMVRTAGAKTLSLLGRYGPKAGSKAFNALKGLVSTGGTPAKTFAGKAAPELYTSATRLSPARMFGTTLAGKGLGSFFSTPEGFEDFDPNAPAPAPASPPPTPAPSAPSAGLGALAPVDMSTIPTKREVAPEKKTEQDAMARLTELFGAVPSAVLSDEELKAMKKQRGYEALMEFGANLMASKSPTLLGGVGEAAAATVPSIKEAGKEQREAAAAKKKETRDTQLQIISTALGMEENEAKRKLQREELNIAERRAIAAEAKQNIASNIIELMQLNPDAATKLMAAQKTATIGQQIQGLSSVLDSLQLSTDPESQAIANKIRASILVLSGYGSGDKENETASGIIDFSKLPGE